MAPWLITLISAGTSIAVAMVGLFVARSKGLPSINAEIETRKDALIDTLQDELTQVRADMTGCKARLLEAERELNGAKRDLRSTQWELLELYRRTGTPVPKRLEETSGDA